MWAWIIEFHKRFVNWTILLYLQYTTAYPTCGDPKFCVNRNTNLIPDFFNNRALANVDKDDVSYKTPQIRRKRQQTIQNV